MERIRLIMSDIDGTIMPPGSKSVSARTVAAFHAAREAGVVIGPASGRGLRQIPAFFAGDDSCCLTCVATNGLEVYHEGEKICERRPPRAALEQLIDVLAEEPGAGIIAFDGTVPYLCCGDVGDLAAVMPGYAKACRPLGCLPDFDALKVNVFAPRDMPATVELCERLNRSIEGIDFDVPMAGYLNIMPAGWNKGTALQFLCDYVGIPVEEAVVFGDAGNDLTMFRVAGHPVAVGNATPEASAAARWHIGRCEDDAVAAAIEALAAGEWPFIA